MIRFVFLVGALLYSASGWSQVGFNNPAPDPTSILDLTAIDKGLLIPRLTTPQREAIVLNFAPGRSLMIFDLTLGKFCFYDGGKWFVLNGWIQEAGSNDVVVTGTVTAPNYALNATGNGPIPKGGIIMWSGTVAEIPLGWALCDGVDNRPNLIDRFVVGAGGSYNPKAFGGNDQFTIAEGNLPRLTHTLTVNGGSHTHQYKDGFSLDGAQNLYPTGYTYDIITGGPYRGQETTDVNNDRMHYRPMVTHGTSDHTHTASSTAHGVTNPTAIDNRPKYYALAFIIKL